MRKKRLFWQIYPAYLVIALASLAVLAADATYSLRRFYVGHTAEDLEARARLVQEQLQPLVKEAKFDEVDALCKRLGTETATRLTAVLPDGRVVGDTDESPVGMDNHGNRPEIVEALEGGVGVSLRDSRTLKESLRYVAVPIRDGGKIIGVARASVSLAAIEGALSGIRNHIAVACLVLAGLLAAASLWIARRIARPLEQLSRGAGRFARGDLAQRLSIPEEREFAALAETLNQMAAELDDKLRTVARQRDERDAVLASMAEGVLVLDGSEHFVRLNEAAGRLLGVEPQRAVGRTLPEVVRNIDLHRLIASVLATQAPAETEIAVRGEPAPRGGGERFIHVHGTLLRNARQGETGVLVVLHDITRLKRLENVRRDFVANVSHELKTPVTAIQGYVETLLDGAKDNREDLEQFLRIVASQTERLHAILEDLLTLARIEQEAEKRDTLLERGPVRPVLEAAVEACRAKAAEKDMRVEVACQGDLQARMNASLLEQAVVNLIDNAINYSPADQAVHVEAEESGGEVHIRVRDQGCGIAREHWPRIFERFYRVDKSRSRKLGGTGLGLAIVKHIMQLHGGRATVESTPGQGSTFTLAFPQEK